ncbi:MAG: heavy-metal-associated domain-containing protein [Lachnospiraceae bacterium]|nr:heavy-metal-associated domain-containing protein [Lachnospiraceae bacterium]
MSTIIICAILVVICFFGIRSSMKRVSNGCCGTGDDVKKVKAEDTDVSHYPYHFEVEVEGMTCNQCKKRVENAFNEKSGFCAKVNLKQKKAEVYAKEQITVQEIRDIVRRSGYDPGTCQRVE